MAAASTQRIDLLLESYLLALACVDQCPESAPEFIKTRLALNLDRAERLYADGAADGLARETGAATVHEAALLQVTARTRAGLRDGGTIGDLAPDLELATMHAKRLFEAASNRAG